MEEQNNNQNASSPRLNPVELLEQLKITTSALEKQISQLNSESASMQELSMEVSDIFDRKVQELKKNVSGIEVGISPEDLKKLESYKDYFKHYKPVLYTSLFVMLSGWGLGIFGAYSGIKWYKESVRTKQEIRSEVLQEIGKDGNVIVLKEQWENYQFQNEVLKEWKKTNPEDSKSLIDYGNGYKAKQKK
ncbi:hypothetical protein SAMN05421866_0060 [Chryseobacterium oranimense]|uniref:Uncharacterized protein n=2 Tax=Chryseobacterium TaxID=59732 RepID=A0A1M5X942_9FLAO|nr:MULTISPECIES: hypothetical protein [Chryseobacterium]KPE49040.1 hypothetical protein AOB46_22170 [Chryseobacterium indologenes]MDN5481250.1 hypothetical protein [Chryseobacterium sp.]SHH96357.1 hypothetical protein SAMN05421866_0060 [Chryseobacterium oranimense]